MKPGWATVALGDVAEVVMGQAPPGSSYNSSGEGLGLIAGAGDFKGGQIVPSKFTSAPGKISRVGDIVLSIRASIGAKVVADDTYCLGRGVAGIRATRAIDTRYLWHVMSWVEPDLRSKGRGATFLQVNRKDVAGLLLPLPPLDEQRHIAAMLDSASTTYRRVQTIGPRLQAAERAVVSRAPWGPGRWSTIGESLKLQSGATLPATRRIPGGVPVYGANGVIGEHDQTTHDAARVTIGRVGAVGAVNITSGPAWISDNALIVKESPGHVTNAYLSHALTLADLGRYASQSAQPLITQSKIAEAPLWIPSPGEAARMQETLMRLEKMRGVAVEHENRAQALFASLQSRAFRGEL